MKRTILNIIMVFSLAIVPAIFISGAASAACTTTPTTSKDQVLSGIGATGGDCSGSGVTDFISAVVQILSVVVGIAAVIMIIISGFKYITSGGDSGKVGSAKSTLVYALVGLLIAALAQLLVHFTLNQSNEAADPVCQYNNKIRTSDSACVPPPKTP